jgi:hypothetical protein
MAGKQQEDDEWWERQQERMRRILKQQRTVYVVPCGAEKLDKPARARDLYVGSMFKMALRSAGVQEDGEIFILSALHGLLHPNDVIEPYDMKMGDRGSVSSATVRRQARKRFGWSAPMNVYTFLPKAYFKILDQALKPMGIYAQDIYEAAPGIGYQRGVCKIVRDSVKCTGSTVAALEAAVELLERANGDREAIAALKAAASALS